MTEGGQSAIIVFFTSEEFFFKKNTFAQILNAWAFLFKTTKFLNEFVEQKKKTLSSLSFLNNLTETPENLSYDLLRTSFNFSKHFKILADKSETLNKL